MIINCKNQNSKYETHCSEDQKISGWGIGNFRKMVIPQIQYLQIIFVFLFCVDISSGQNWQNYPYAPGNSFLNFPSDDGYHPAPNTSTEWWYINLSLTGSAPAFKKYSVMLCYFRFANMRIFNIASETDKSFNNDVLQAFPVLNFQLNHWDLTYTKIPPNAVNDYSKWTYQANGVPYSYIYHAEDPVHNNGLDVTVTSNRPPLVVGANGYIALGDKGDSSFYYSYSNMNVKGKIKYKGVTDNITSGIAWIDRQYGPFTVGVNSSNLYEWFSLQLDEPGTILGVPNNPAEFNIWQIFSDSTSVPYKAEWRLVSGIYPDDSQDTSSSFIFERTGYWYDPGEGKYYSQGWRFINPAKDITVDLYPPVKDQLVDVTLFRFWEGGVNLKGVIQNKNVDGVGFAEIVAGHKFQIVVPSIPQGLNLNSFPDHNSLTWQPSNPGTFPIGGYRIFRSTSNDGHWKYLGSTTNLNYDDYTPTPDSAYYYSITSFDNQTGTSASDYSASVFAAPLTSNELFDLNINANIFPNPINKTSKIQIYLTKMESIKIEVYDLPGRKVRSIFNSSMAAGMNSIDFLSGGLGQGTYLLKIETERQKRTLKFVEM